MRDDYLKNARKVIDDPNVLVNVISLRVKQLKRGYRPLVESLEKLLPEDIALREVAEGKISFELATPEDLARLAGHRPDTGGQHSPYKPVGNRRATSA
ncbi:MAG: DNA-directed RNA polymerase subunit omega [Opitutales bacterium]